MTRLSSAAFALLATAAVGALSGCATPAGPIEVTRFSRPELATAARGPITVVPAFSAGADSLEYRSYAAAISQELARLGYRDVPGSATVAVVDVQRQVEASEPRNRSGVSVGVGGSTGGGGWHSGGGLGLGVGVGFNLGGGPKPRIETMLTVTIRDRASNVSLWEGRARLIAPSGSPLANSQIGAAKMAQALFQGFPGRSGETIEVR
jgi:hypothetical protein